MFEFKGWMENTLGSGVRRDDYSHMNLRQRLDQGKRGEQFVIDQLAKHGVNVSRSNVRQDKTFKIDGFLDGKPSEAVQIKIRKTNRGGGDDIAYELLRNHDNSRTIADQLKDPLQQGRDYFGKVVKHYFVLDQTETKIYYIPAGTLRAAVSQALRELGNSRLQGVLSRPYRTSLGVDLRPTRDNDPMSFTPFKVMAFVPAEVVAVNIFPVQ